MIAEAMAQSSSASPEAKEIEKGESGRDRGAEG